MAARDRLHRLVDELPDGQATVAAERSLVYLRELGDDPVLRALLDAPIDDEELTDEERSALAEGLEDIERGDVLTDEELRRELGL
jgi:hypothetical protein